MANGEMVQKKEKVLEKLLINFNNFSNWFIIHTYYYYIGTFYRNTND